MAGMRIELNKVDAVLAALDPVTYNKAVRRTMRETGRTVLKELSKSIRQQYAVKAGDVKEKARLDMVNGEQAIITISGKKLPLDKFGARQTKRGVSVRIRKDRPRQIVKRAWIKKGGTRVLRRHLKYDTSAGKALKRQMRAEVFLTYGLSVADMAHDDNVRKALDEGIGKFRERLQRNLDFYWSKK